MFLFFTRKFISFASDLVKLFEKDGYFVDFNL